MLIVFIFLCGSIYVVAVIYKIYCLEVDGYSSRDESFLRYAIGTFIFCVLFMLFCFSFLIYAIIFASKIDIHREGSLGLSKICDSVTYEISLVGAKGIGFICYDQAWAVDNQSLRSLLSIRWKSKHSKHFWNLAHLGQQTVRLHVCKWFDFPKYNCETNQTTWWSGHSIHRQWFTPRFTCSLSSIVV